MEIDFIAEAITAQFGERCPDYAEGCPCCDAWKQYDNLRSLIPVAQKKADEIRQYDVDAAAGAQAVVDELTKLV